MPRKLYETVLAVVEASRQARERADKRAKLIALAAYALEHGTEGVDYYV